MSWRSKEDNEPQAKRLRTGGRPVQLKETDNPRLSNHVVDEVEAVAAWGVQVRALSAPEEINERLRQQGESLNAGPSNVPSVIQVPTRSCFLQATDGSHTPKERVEVVREGYCPITSGDQLGSYSALKLLGQGAYSEVWLGYEEQQKKYVALKITRAGKLEKEGCLKEIRFMNAANEIGDHLGWDFIMQMHESFSIDSCIGPHLVMAMEVLGPSLHRAARNLPDRKYPPRLTEKILRQVLKACAYLHTKCKIIHCDLKTDNIMIAINEADIQRMADKNAVVSTMRMEIEGEDNPENISFPLYYSFDVCEPHRNIFVKIGDFGISSFTYEPTVKTVQTCEYRSPEAFLRADLTPAADMWSVACIAFELATGRSMFPCNRQCRELHRMHHLQEIQNLLGTINPSVFKNSRDESLFFKNGRFNGNILYDNGRVLATLLEVKNGLTEDYSVRLANFLLPMLRFCPETRVTAEKALEHSFLETCAVLGGSDNIVRIPDSNNGSPHEFISSSSTEDSSISPEATLRSPSRPPSTPPLQNLPAPVPTPAPQSSSSPELSQSGTPPKNSATSNSECTPPTPSVFISHNASSALQLDHDTFRETSA
uniref:non-specific serine/threonine protein kinase n=1 Tax=Caenorhabditis tropicalis TaxID=1561998 RepID=A0A1I7TLR0_9PELO